MRISYFVFLVTIHAEVECISVHGEVSLKLLDPGAFRYKKRSRPEEGNSTDGAARPPDGSSTAGGAPSTRAPGRMTEAPLEECVYQYPEEAHVQALLSNMMNELTKMYERARSMVTQGEGGAGERRRGETRFRVVSKKNTDFFEGIYSNMTTQYLSYYNTTAVRVDRTDGTNDPCKNQPEMKEIWRDLVESSLATYRQAAFRCIDEHLKSSGVAKDSPTRQRLNEYLLQELSSIRSSQLALLCDRFQLCYHDLARRSN